MNGSIEFAIDVMAVFNGRLHLSGWIFGEPAVVAVSLRSSGLTDGEQAIRSYGLTESPDVARHFGRAGRRARFNETFDFDANQASLAGVALVIRRVDGSSSVVGDLLARQPDAANGLLSRFTDLLGTVPVRRMLEVGSRARSGVVRRDLVPAGWNYLGLDVIDGPNVDRVGDVHEASNLFAAGSFGAVMAFSVLEHLLMPWKAVIELNHVLAVGAVGIFTTHQCWPLHDQPWDFWRYSDRAWDGLMNKATGFEVIDTAMGEPAFLVAQRCHPVTNFGLGQSGYLASNVLFRKTGPTTLQWPVTLADVTSTRYPTGNIA